jgi:hypothetical protein
VQDGQVALNKVDGLFTTAKGDLRMARLQILRGEIHADGGLRFAEANPVVGFAHEFIEGLAPGHDQGDGLKHRTLAGPVLAQQIGPGAGAAVRPREIQRHLADRPQIAQPQALQEHSDVLRLSPGAA